MKESLLPNYTYSLLKYVSSMQLSALVLAI